MKQFILLLTFIAIPGICALAQSNDDFKKTEFFIGYSYGQAEAHFSNVPSVYKDRAPLSGFNASAVFNVNRYFGIKGDVSGTYNKTRVSFPAVPSTPGPLTGSVAFDSRNSLYNVLGGVQIKDNASENRVKPFAHALVGAGFRKNDLTTPIICVGIIICPGSTSETGLAGAFGGGLDVKINNRIDFRAFQVDYNPIRFNGGVDHNMRIGIGIVFK